VHPRKLSAIALGAIVLAAIVVAGCGGSSLSNGQLQTDVTKICSLTSARTNHIPTPGSPNATLTYLDQGIAALTPELKGLQALHPTGDDAQVYRSTVKTFSDTIDALKEASRGLRRGDDPVKTLQDLQRRLGPLVSQENGGWDALELPACESH
jgi:hypothetical protein